MNLTIFSYRYASEILQHQSYVAGWNEIMEILSSMPVFLYENKSRNKPELDVVQGVMNTYLDRKFAVEFAWEYHPSAVADESSGLKADFQKDLGGLIVQTEVQFGNIARWYSDIFKFQAAYSQNIINVGLSVVACQSLANRMDQNLAYFERILRELPYAQLSITLPILVIGMEPDNQTQTINLSDCKFKNISEITKNEDNRYRIVNGFLSGVPMNLIGPDSEVGPKPSS
jgi:hypothetical protein